MQNKRPYGASKVLFGCGVLFFVFFGFIGLVASFFLENKELAASVRSRSIMGLIIGILIVVAWKIIDQYVD